MKKQATRSPAHRALVKANAKLRRALMVSFGIIVILMVTLTWMHRSEVLPLLIQFLEFSWELRKELADVGMKLGLRFISRR